MEFNSSKCFMCKSKAGSLKLSKAVQCAKCEEYFHRSCAAKISLNKKSVVNICCAQKVDNINTQRNTFPVIGSPQISQIDLGEPCVDLDDNLIPLWNLISQKVVSKLDDISASLTSTSDRLDTVEDRIGDLEEDVEQLRNDVYNEASERIKREKNVIIFNFNDTPEAVRTDLKAIQNLFSSSGIDLPFDLNNIKVVRLGRKFIQGKTRPLKISFQSAEYVDWVFVNKKKLGDGSLWISGDLTKRQQDEMKHLRAELKARIDKGEEDIYIAYSNRIPYIAKKKINK